MVLGSPGLPCGVGVEDLGGRSGGASQRHRVLLWGEPAAAPRACHPAPPGTKGAPFRPAAGTTIGTKRDKSSRDPRRDRAGVGGRCGQHLFPGLAVMVRLSGACLIWEKFSSEGSRPAVHLPFPSSSPAKRGSESPLAWGFEEELVKGDRLPGASGTMQAGARL